MGVLETRFEVDDDSVPVGVAVCSAVSGALGGGSGSGGGGGNGLVTVVSRVVLMRL